VAIQIARARGAEVFATARAADADYVRSLGASPIDFERTGVDDYVSEHSAGRGFAVVFDTVGGTTLELSFAAVARYGHVVSSVGWGTHALSPLTLKGASFSGVFTLIPLLTGDGRAHHAAILGEAAQLAHDSKLVPRLDPRSFGLDERVAEAYEAITTRRARGKLVVSIA
jgi:NADPH2:quinone reductase